MNKKFFAALMASGMLMGSPMGVLAAEEMVEVEAGAVGGTTVDQATEVKLDDVNFPDKNFRDAVDNALQKMGITPPSGSSTLVNTMVSTEDLAKIVTLGNFGQAIDPTKITTSDLGAIDYDTTGTPVAKPIKDLTGIEYLTGLQVLNLQYSPDLKVADLTDNEELVAVVIAPVPVPNPTSTIQITTDANGSINGVNVPPLTFNGASGALEKGPSQLGTNSLFDITLPEETANLSYLVVEGASQLTTLDLSSYDSLVQVDLQNNELAQLNVEGCSSITKLDVSGNELTGLDVSTLKALQTLTATDNDLYELELPSGKTLATVNVSDNKLASIDVSSLRGLNTLNVSDNRLESIDLSNTKTIVTLDVSNNHLATLDLTGLTNLTTPKVSPQYLYANTTDAGIDLASYDENFQANSSDVGWLKDVNASANDPSNKVTGGVITKAGVLEFGSNINPTGLNGTPANSTGISYDYAYGEVPSVTGSAPSASRTKVMTVNIVQADLMNRLYNPNSGEHFYTADLNEKDTLVKLGWQAEGIGWVAPAENYPTEPVQAGDAVFRLYNKNAGDHHYTADSKEKDTLVRAGWNYEGVGWYSGKYHNDDGGTPPATMKAYTIEVYREYNPNAKEAGAHNYTTSENENDTLVALGWLDEGLGWWALK